MVCRAIVREDTQKIVIQITPSPLIKPQFLLREGNLSKLKRSLNLIKEKDQKRLIFPRFPFQETNY